MDQLVQWLKEIGVGPVTGLVIWLVVTAGIAAIRGLHILAMVSHGRRKEFLEIYEKLCAGSADALALETVIRHHFGIWIPAKAIERIRQSHSPCRRLLALDGRLEFLDCNEAKGTFTVKKWCADERKRRRHIVLRLALYMFFIFAALFVAGLFGDLSKLPIILTLILAPIFLISGIFFLDNAANLKKLSSIIKQFPDLFETATHPVAQESEVAPSLSKDASPGVISRWVRSARTRFLATRSPAHQPAKPGEPERSNRPTSAESTPRE